MADGHVHDLWLLPQVDLVIEFVAPCCGKFLMTSLPAGWVSYPWADVVTKAAHHLGGRHRGTWGQYRETEPRGLGHSNVLEAERHSPEGSYDGPTDETAFLRGGPFDGELEPFPPTLLDDVCPRLVRRLPPQLLPPDPDPAKPPHRVPRAVYQALRDHHGFFSRDDRGRIRFDFWGFQ
ncbi:hypothetical protein [Streptomyces sp. NRRL S-350]|uniref:hypothetical protein n=1 Tax=Streptomyces sp. NRRL S-350 TaxID=1463902 RepID=UPI0004C04308|nr:hypothetical protein [Streptomyces sp. NRRL S-350]